MAQPLPHIDLIRWTFDLTPNGTVVYRYTRRSAAVSDVFSLQPVIPFVFMAMHATDVAHVLRHGCWPDDIGQRPEANIRRREWVNSIDLLDLNTARAETLAAQGVAA